jgi:hypothetical protein
MERAQPLKFLPRLSGLTLLSDVFDDIQPFLNESNRIRHNAPPSQKYGEGPSSLPPPYVLRISNQPSVYEERRQDKLDNGHELDVDIELGPAVSLKGSLRVADDRSGVCGSLSAVMPSSRYFGVIPGAAEFAMMIASISRNDGAAEKSADRCEPGHFRQHRKRRPQGPGITIFLERRRGSKYRRISRIPDAPFLP